MSATPSSPRQKSGLSPRRPEFRMKCFCNFPEPAAVMPWQGAESSRHRRLKPLVLAEYAENRSRFLPAIGHLIELICAKRT